jgi:SET domain
VELDALPKRHAVYECSDLCACSRAATTARRTGEALSCGNRRAQAGVRRRLAVRPTTPRAGTSGYKGLGVFACEDLKKGTFVCLYAGEVISTAEARARWKERQGHGNYVLVLRETVLTAEGDEETLKTIVDPTHIGNVGSVVAASGGRLVLPTTRFADNGFFSRRFISEACVPWLSPPKMDSFRNRMLNSERADPRPRLSAPDEPRHYPRPSRGLSRAATGYICQP